MLMQVTINSEILKFELPSAVQLRLQELLDRQEQGIDLSVQERDEAEGLVELAEFLSLLRLRSQRVSSS